MEQQEQFAAASNALRAGDARKAADMCEASLAKHPGDANFLCLAARSNLALREFAVAETRIEQAIQLFPDFALAHEVLGDLLLVQGKVQQALSAYQTSMRLDPAQPGPHRKIARIEQIERDVAATAVTPAQQQAFDAELKKARELERNGEVRSAELIYRDILTKHPNHVEAARLLAAIAVQQKRYRDAEVFLKKALENAPDYTRAWADLSNAQREAHHFDDAVQSAARVLRLAPDKAESHMLYASAIGLTGDHEAAIRAYEKALDIAPDRAGTMSSIAHHLKTIGRQADAVASYRNAIAAKPDHAEAYWSLANLKTFRFEDHEVSAMLALLERGDLADEARAQIHNALGLEYEGRQDYDAAFENFAQCNEIQRRHESYDPVDTEDTYGRLIEMFDKEFIDKHSVTPGPVTPVLIVGLPRSGSTLIEQILASHSQVDGTHELGELSRAVQAVRRQVSRRGRFPEALADIGADQWRQIGEEYLQSTAIFRSGAPFFVDKNPNNFIYTGILRLCLPNAKVIDARRHPLDSCLGSFKQLFASGQPFTYDLTELGEYYLQYRRLMDHWHAVLPGYVLDVQYEDVVANLDFQVRRILDYCGLPFEEACLRFYETDRAVKTASSEQVRQPIYSSSVNLWRNYERHLDTLVHILKPCLPEQNGPAKPKNSAK